MSSTVDFTAENNGSFFLLRPRTDAAEIWIEDRLSADRQEFGGAVVVEIRYIGDIVLGLRAEGYTVELAGHRTAC